MANGIIDVPSRYSVPETLARLQSILKEKGLTVFAIVDHSGEAEKAGLAMRSTQLLIFGSPKGGTPLMVAAPRLAIDLPLKALAWQDEQGQVWLSYNSPEYLQQRHGFPRRSPQKHRWNRWADSEGCGIIRACGVQWVNRWPMSKTRKEIRKKNPPGVPPPSWCATATSLDWARAQPPTSRLSLWASA
jgi:uncharacterized protein (DUF302 family)